MNSLEKELNKLCDPFPFHVGWSFIDLKSNERIDRNGDVVVPSASTRKIAILATALKAVASGLFRLDEPITISDRYHDSNSGIFRYLSSGITITFQDALVGMIVVSDNTCTGEIIERIGVQEVNNFCRSIGMNHTLHRWGFPPYKSAMVKTGNFIECTNLTTPNDVSTLLETPVKGRDDKAVSDKLGIPPEFCELALGILLKQKLNCRLPALLPKEAKVAHKTGTNFKSRNDAGVIYINDAPRFILSVYTSELDQYGDAVSGFPIYAQADRLISSLCKECYDQLKP